MAHDLLEGPVASGRRHVAHGLSGLVGFVCGDGVDDALLFGQSAFAAVVLGGDEEAGRDGDRVGWAARTAAWRSGTRGGMMR